MSLAQSTFDNVDGRDGVFDESRACLPSQLGILFQSNDGPSENRSHRRFVPRTGPDDEDNIGAGNRCRLQQPRRDHWLHQETPAAERQIVVDIGNPAKVPGHKQLAPYAAERA
jgi:hypothetical protein